jgi:hypothetical protein
MITGVCWLLSDWPTRLENSLKAQIAINNKWSGNSSTMRVLGPIQRYFETHIEPGDFKFISSPYETFVRLLVRNAGFRLPRVDSRQLELDLL